MRILAILAILASSSTMACGQTFLLEGQILSGTTLFTINEPDMGTEFGGFGFPEGGYPVPYTATLEADANSDLWDFSFAATDAVETVGLIVDGPSAVDMGDTNTVVSTPKNLTIEFSRFLTFGTNFNLELDLLNETGTWTWTEFCPVCDLARALPSATASVTSIQIVPEPHSLILAFAGAAVGVCRLRRATRLQVSSR